MMASGLFSWESEKRDLWAVYVAAFFHLVGLVGIILDLGFVTSLTPFFDFFPDCLESTIPGV